MYYTLVVKRDGVWIPEFGDYDKTVVTDERNDMRNSGVSAKNMKIVKTDSSQAAIDDAVSQMNDSK